MKNNKICLVFICSKLKPYEYRAYWDRKNMWKYKLVFTQHTKLIFPLFQCLIHSFIFRWEYVQQFLYNPIVHLLNTIRWPNKPMESCCLAGNQTTKILSWVNSRALSWIEWKCKENQIYGNQCFEMKDLTYKICIVHFISVVMTL